MPKTSTEPRPDFSVEEQAGFLLRRAYQRAAENLARAIGEGVTAPQFAVLARLYERGALSQNRLGRLVDMEPATIHGVIRRLRKAGLLETRSDPEDGRRMLVSLTAAGLERMAVLVPLSRKADAKTVAPLTADERATLLSLLKRVAAGQVS